jgi:hypothetical protein
MDLRTLLDIPPWDWPRDVGKRLQKTLIDRRAKAAERLVAAELAGDLTVMNDDLASALMTVVRSADEPDELRAKAATSFGAVLELADVEGFEDSDELPISERTFHNIQELLQQLYLDSGIPKNVRRRILEASVRAPESWHPGAIRAAYATGDRDWMLTAVFAMRWVRGFDDQILEAFKNGDPQIHIEAVEAAGTWALKGAWRQVLGLVTGAATPKPLLLAAIGAVASIRPTEARNVLEFLTDSDDEEIAEAADEAIAMAEAIPEEDDDEGDARHWVN